MKSEIIKDLIGKLILIIIILALCHYAAAVTPDPEEPSLCIFPCEFPAPVYHLAVTSAKYEWIEKHRRPE